MGALAIGITEEEQVLFNEVKKVMDKYPDLDRKFGVHWIHSHFEVAEGEVLHETHDEEKRVLTTNVIPAENLPKDSFATQWVYDENGNIQVGVYCCDVPAPIK
ncbi:hypothetical protein [Planococcus lenghuensis]|uniref:Uncharacterized protein n=1 Tax=Planococcus lenghuensis TaxID=2213202 RepID=A0A1Q2L5B0_9BACL|nr:hypothetical protein [Planococcus lenghuensis]AQQ55630.1 hypothetical protein B0X71_20870 [Planococcus lenghuensis]